MIMIYWQNHQINLKLNFVFVLLFLFFFLFAFLSAPRKNENQIWFVLVSKKKLSWIMTLCFPIGPQKLCLFSDSFPRLSFKSIIESQIFTFRFTKKKHKITRIYIYLVPWFVFPVWKVDIYELSKLSCLWYYIQINGTIYRFFTVPWHRLKYKTEREKKATKKQTKNVNIS